MTDRAVQTALRNVLEPIFERDFAPHNKTLRGWGQYFRHSSYDLEDINSWVRQRLRGILRRRSKHSGRPTVVDQKRWPNAYFVRAGLHLLHADPQLKLPIQNLAF